MGSRQALSALFQSLIEGWPFDLSIGESLKILPSGNDRGSLQVGNGTTSMDVFFYGNSASNYIQFDASTNQLIFTGINTQLSNLTFSGNTTFTSDGTITFSADAIVFDTDVTVQGTLTTEDTLITEGDITVVEHILLDDDASVTFGDGVDVRLSWNGTYLIGRHQGLWTNAPSKADPGYDSIAHEIFDDFVHPASATASDVQAWTSNDDGATGTNAFQDTAGGVYNVVTEAADNDYHAMSSVNEVFLFLAAKKLWFEARFRLAEAATSNSAWWFGLTDTLTTGGFQADTGGPLASYDGALIWKDEASLEIDCETSNAGTQLTNTNVATFVSNTWTTVGFHFDGTATTSIVTFYVDGTLVATRNITLSGLEEMHAVFGVKAGPGGQAETLQIDYVKFVQLR